MSNECKHEWHPFEGSHIVSDGKSEQSVVVIEICEKCKSARKSAYQLINE